MELSGLLEPSSLISRIRTQREQQSKLASRVWASVSPIAVQAVGRLRRSGMDLAPSSSTGGAADRWHRP